MYLLRGTYLERSTYDFKESVEKKKTKMIREMPYRHGLLRG